MTTTASTPGHPFLDAHAATIEEASEALRTRSFYSRYPGSPSPRVYGEGSAEAGKQAYDAHLGGAFTALDDQPGTGERVGDEVSPYGPTLGVTYPVLDLDVALPAAKDAMRAWRDAGPRVRAAVCVEMLERLNKRSFEVANAVMHTSGQPFVMSFQAGGPEAQDRALEAIVAGLAEMERIPASVTWEKPAKGDPIRMQKDYKVIGRGVGLVIGCNTFPTWNGYPGMFASLVTGNAVVVKPHPRAILPLAITVAVCREVLAEAGFDKALVQLAPDHDGGTLAKDIALRDEVAIIDYTGGPGFGAWLETEAVAAGKLVYTEKAGVNTIVLDSTDALKPMLGNLAFSLSLYSGQMCTAPQNIYAPKDGIDTDEGHLSFDELADKLATAVSRFTGDDAKAVEILGTTVNDQVRANIASIGEIAAEGEGRVVLEPRKITHPAFPDAVVYAPGIVAVDVRHEDVYTEERFGPVSFLIATESTEQSLAQLADTVKEHGAMTASVYSTSEDVLEQAREAAADGGVALSENLLGQVFVNQTTAFSDLHGTGANPAANAAYTDSAFVANRFRVITSRRHV
ncbi:phenylacetic acid degradation protein PaaN [Arsenicicoccus dermatophilus]|uniref:phenylacetic acid degradation protein PaaN n=1 Tax=Arsenicicoccus dermatophilus TaxID=1076331 RepID=UPI003916FDF7